MATPLPPYRDCLDRLSALLLAQGYLSLLLVDVSEIAQVERDYGSRIFGEILASMASLVNELKGSEIRQDDVLTVNERGGNAFLVFLGPKRGEPENRVRMVDIAAAAERVGEHLNRRLSRISSPYVRKRPHVTVGFGLVFHNPLIHPEHLVGRLVEEAWEAVRIQRMQRAFQDRVRIQEILLAGHITTLFQPIFSLQEPGVLGYEALSRGPMGTPQASPIGLFEFAAEADLTFELDRFCRLRAFEKGSELPAESKLFVNVFPSAMYDPDFQGAALIKLLGGLGLNPAQIVLEVTEQYAIDNYTVFMEAMQNFTQMGFQIAVDDVGAGYSSLEKVARLKPKYLKFDMRIVRGIDGSHIQREMARALKSVAEKMDAMVIAEGIEREGELAAVRDLGIEYGQGYLLGRPADLQSIKASLANGGPPAAAGAPGPTPTASSKTASTAQRQPSEAAPPAPVRAPLGDDASKPWEPSVEPPATRSSTPGPSFAFPDDEPPPPHAPLPEAIEGGQAMLPPGFDED